MAFVIAKSDQIVSAEEEAELDRIASYFDLSEADLKSSKRELARLRLLEEIQKGNLPRKSIDDFSHKKGEEIFWSEIVTLLEQKVVRRTYKGTSHALSFRIAKGVTYRIGSQQGALEDDVHRVKVCDGELLISNQRISFRSAFKTITTKMEKVIDLQLYSNAMVVSEESKSKPRIYLFKVPENVGIAGEIISHIVNSPNIAP